MEHHSHLLNAFTLAAMITTGHVAAQSFTFEQDMLPYDEISAGTAVNIQGGWGQINALDGEAFNYFGESFVFGGAWQIWVHQSGFVNIDHAPVSTIFISGLFKNFNDLQSIDGTSSITYAVEGASGSKRLIVQWKNYRSSGAPAGHFANFQIILDQENGSIHLHYGPSADPGHVYASGSGPNAGIYFADYDASPIYERMWLQGSPDSPTIDTSLDWVFPGMMSDPPDGTLYSFVPGSSSIQEFERSIDAWYAHGSLVISSTIALNDIEIFDAAGRSVIDLHTDDRITHVDVSHLPAGLYFPLVRAAGSLMPGPKFIIQR